MKRIVLLIYVFLSPLLVMGQMSFSEGTYVRFKTLKHRISEPDNAASRFSGVYKLTGREIMDLGILQQSAPTTGLDIRCRLDGTLAPLNAPNEPMGADFSIAYYVNNEYLTDLTEYWFYIPPSFDLSYDVSTKTSDYTGNPYSDEKYFLVSGGNTNYQPLPLEQVPADTASRQLNARATWVYDTALYNLVGTGRRWMGELFDFTTEREYNFKARTSGANSSANMPVAGTEIKVQVKAVARASSNGTKLRIEYGNQSAEVSFPAFISGSYVQEKALTTTFIADQNSTVKVIYDKAGNTSAAMWLDELIVDWETPALHPDPSYFLVNNPRGAGNYSHFQTEWTNEVLIFGVEANELATKVTPAVENTVGQNGWEATWYSHEDKLRAYKIGDATTALEYRVDATVDLADLESAKFTDLSNAESIIIAPDSLLEEALELADVERTTGVETEVVALSYIYDLMNTGNPDIGAIRKFLVRAYNDFEVLKYVTLFGDASYDYKKVLSGPKSNLVPTYHTNASFSLLSSYITDDYYGYLDHGESINWFLDDLDIGIGRIPVQNKHQAKESVTKIRRYLESEERFGPWRMNALWVADDVDQGWEKEFQVVQDRFTREIDTIRPEVNSIKIYSDAYLQESMPGSQRYPEARQKLFREVENGAMLVSYVGHGGEVGWATERILQLEDINGWSNSVKMPVFTTITCEFARFDDPNRVSAAEQLFLNPIGGAIGLFSTTRSVFATNSTYQLNELLNTNMLFMEEPRFGDVIRETKNNNISGDKIKFSLLGDAAIPLPRPKDGVVFDSINGVVWDQFQDTVKALNWVRIQGTLRNTDSSLMTGFNGKVWLQFYDKKQSVQTKVNDQAGGAFNFTTQNNAVFKGQATVTNGRFSIEFRVPLDINLSVGPPKVAAYATNFEDDFWGASHELLLGSIYDGVVTDTEGPEVRLFIDDTNFVSGGISDKDPNAIGLLHDESGINAVGLGIGHNLTLILDGESVNVNEYYESAVDDFTRGTINYPYYDLEVGQHSLELRAWDVLNQWGYDSISFFVVDAAEPILEQLVAYPNPFTEYVNFSLNHNQSEEPGFLRMDIINNQGQTLWSWEDEFVLNGASTTLPQFTISEVAGKRPGPGFYHVRIQWTRNIDGKSASIQEKLIYIR